MKDGENLLFKNMSQAKITEEDIINKLRECNITRRSQIKALVFETSSDLSVLSNKTEEELNPWILKCVQHKKN